MEIKKIATKETKLSYLLHEDMGISSAQINRLKYLFAFKVNGTIQKTDYIVKLGDIVTAEIFPDDDLPIFPAEKGDISIIYEDDAILVCDKESGMAVHPTHARWDGTLANRVLYYYEQTNQKCGMHVVTRLDRDTKGLVLFAKNSYVTSRLKCIEKTYLAVVTKDPPKDKDTINLPIAREKEGSMIRCVREDGKESITEYKKIGPHLLELKAVTGRTHQLRVHCSHLGFPIEGDPLYGGGNYPGGQRLVAYKLEFDHPLTGKHLIITSNIQP